MADQNPLAGKYRQPTSETPVGFTVFRQSPSGSPPTQWLAAEDLVADAVKIRNLKRRRFAFVETPVDEMQSTFAGSTVPLPKTACCEPIQPAKGKDVPACHSKL
jgi:hypothetical protein